MTIEPSPAIMRAKRFQFTLSDAYLVLGLIGVAFCVGEHLREDENWWSRPTREAVALIAVGSTCIGAGLGLWRSYVRCLEGATNFGSILWYVAVVWVAVLYVLKSPRSIELLALPITLGLACFGMWQGRRKGRDHAACLGTAALTVAGGWLLIGLAADSLSRRRGCPAYESSAIAACKTYAEAQDIYRRTDWDGDGALEYAASIRGNYSLYEKQSGFGDLTLVDRAFAESEGLPGVAEPKAGYVFKVLTAQGAGAPGGAKSYFDERGNLSLGYALVASPSHYGETGRNTFIINNQGTVYQTDLGEGTAEYYRSITAYDPGPMWVIAE